MADREEEREEEVQEAEEEAEAAEEAAEEAEEEAEEAVDEVAAMRARLDRLEGLAGEMAERLASHGHEHSHAEERETVEPPPQERIRPIPDHPWRRLPRFI